MKAVSKNTAGYTVDFKKVDGRVMVTYENGEVKDFAESTFKRQFKIVEEVVEMKKTDCEFVIEGACELEDSGYNGEECPRNKCNSYEAKSEGVDEVIIATVNFAGVEVPVCEGPVVIEEGSVEVTYNPEDRLIDGGMRIIKAFPDKVVNGDIVNSNETVEGEEFAKELLPTVQEENLAVFKEVVETIMEESKDLVEESSDPEEEKPFIEETFEQWIARTCTGVSDIPIELSIKGSTKVRDSARVAFLENKKAYERTEETLEGLANKEQTAEVVAEVALLHTDLGKYSERARKYYSRYSNAKEVLAVEKEKAVAVIEAEAQAKFDAAQEEKVEGSNEEA